MLRTKYSAFKIAGSNLEILRIYLHFGFILGFAPFKLTKDEASGRFRFESTFFSKIRFGILTLCVIYRLTNRWITITVMNPVRYFTFAAVICGTMFIYAFLMTFWTKKSEILEIFNFSQDIVTSEAKRSELPQKCHEWSQSGLISAKMRKIKAFQCTTTHLSILAFSLSGIVAVYEPLTRFIFEQHSKKTLTFTSCFGLGIEFAELLLNLVFLILVHFQDLIFLVTTLVVKEIVDECYDELQAGDLSGEQALKSYSNMKSKVKAVNNAFQTLILFCIFGSIPFYAFNLIVVMDVPAKLSFETVAKKLNTLLYFYLIGKSMLIAAGANKKAGEFANWLARDDNASKIPAPKLTVILHELSQANIGLRGNDFFVISYPFVGSVAGLLVTYAILATQLQTGQQLK